MQIRDLASALQANIGSGPVGHDWWGIVTAVNAGPPKTVTVKVNGSASTILCRYSASYGAVTPAVNDVVFGRMDTMGDCWVVDRLA